MKNYIKVLVFIVFAVGLLFSIVNLYPSKSFAQRLLSESTLDEDFTSTLDEYCLPGICDDGEEDNPYLDVEDEENDQLRDNDLPNNDLPNDSVPDDELPDELPRVNELPKTRELPRTIELPKIIEQPETIEFEEAESLPAVNEDDMENDINDAIQQLIEDEEMPEENGEKQDEIFKKNQENLVALSEVELIQKTEEAVLKEEEKAIEQGQEEDEKEIEELTIIIEESEAFQELIPVTPTVSGGGGGGAPSAFAPAITDTNRNGIPDGVEKAAGLDPTKADRELVKIKTDLAVQKVKLAKEGKSKKEIQAMIKKELKKKKTERKKKVIRQAAEKKFNNKIASSAQDTNKDGVSDEMEVILGLDPRIKADTKAEFSPAEKMIYGVKTPAVGKKCTMSLNYGDKLPSKGFTVLAACPKNKTFALYAVDKKGNETELSTKTASSNSKLAFTVDKKFKTGKYAFQIRPAKTKTQAFLWSDIFAPERANAQSEDDTEKSDAVLADIVEDTEIPQPVVQKIENVDVAAVRDIKVSATADGKIRVTGVTDLDTTVIGTFESAVFTSALLADVENGAFEITSSQPLTEGDHEVAIYASRPEDQIQSPPVKLSFSIIQTAKAAAPEIVGARSAAEEETGFPIIPVAVGGIIIIAIGAIFAWRKSSAKV